MNKNYIYSGIFLALLLLVIYLIMGDRDNNTMIDDKAFAFTDTAAITKIFMTDKSGNEILLQRENGRWVVNDKFPVMPAKMKVLLSTIKKVRVSYPVPKIAHDNVVKEMATDAIKVEIYAGSDAPQRTYYVGGPTNDHKGTYMLLEEDGVIDDRPYVNYIPGFDGYLTIRYIMDEIDWRDPSVFDYTLNQIESVKLDYPDQPNRSFELKILGPDSFSLTSPAVSFTEKQTSKPLNGNFVLQYINSFKNINAEAFENDYAKKDSIFMLTPFCDMTVTTFRGDTNHIVVYPMPQSRRSKMQFDPEGNPIEYDLDRYFALINDGKDFVIIQQYVFGKLFKGYNEFFQKAGQQSNSL